DGEQAPDFVADRIPPLDLGLGELLVDAPDVFDVVLDLVGAPPASGAEVPHAGRLVDGDQRLGGGLGVAVLVLVDAAATTEGLAVLPLASAGQRPPAGGAVVDRGDHLAAVRVSEHSGLGGAVVRGLLAAAVAVLAAIPEQTIIVDEEATGAVVEE